MSLLPDGFLNKKVNTTGLKEYVLSAPHEICQFSGIKSEDEEMKQPRMPGPAKTRKIKKMKTQTRSKREDN